MLAPEPFFQPRGTPFSEYHRIKALTELGHRIDLVTYPIGADVDLPNLRIIRSSRPPWIRDVAIGPSLTKMVLDAALTVTAMRQSRRERYDAIHSHEEAGLLGVWLARRLRIPHLYDMHSSLPQQLTNFRATGSALVRRVFEAMERKMVADSRVVITICQELQDTVIRMGAGDRSILIENVMGGDMEPTTDDASPNIRLQLGLDAERPIVLYTGTFEPYQGLDLLLDAMAIVQRRHPRAVLVVVGGEAGQVAGARDRAAALGVDAVFTGRQPAADIPAYLEACDVLASPRISGTNTPLKIYSYLRSGKPIVATNLRTHTQVLSDAVAALADPTPESFAEAITRLLDDPSAGERLAVAARQLAETRYSRASYVARTREAVRRLLGDDLPPVPATSMESPTAGTRVEP